MAQFSQTALTKTLSVLLWLNASIGPVCPKVDIASLRGLSFSRRDEVAKKSTLNTKFRIQNVLHGV